MADFTARIVTALSVMQWTDTPTGSAPTRINPNANRPHLYLQASEGLATMQLAATVGGVEGPANIALGGRLFKWSWVEHPRTIGPPAIWSPAGFSSVCNISGSPFLGQVGHYTILCWRDGGGAQLITWEAL
jgi:hypothetical protein